MPDALFRRVRDAASPTFLRVRDAASQSVRPGLALQLTALALLLAWQHVPAVRALLDQLMQLKLAHGLSYAFITGAFFAGVLPRLLMWATGLHQGSLAIELLFATVFWGLRGIEVDLFYQLQAHWFGNGDDWGTVLRKAFVDQFLYSAFWAVPVISIAYAWKDAGGSLRVLRSRLDTEFWHRRLPAAVAANLMVWLPTVLVIYQLPQPLQLPVSNLVASFGVIVVLLVARGQQQRPAQATMRRHA